MKWCPPSWEQEDHGVGFGAPKGCPLPLLLALGSRRVATHLGRAGCLVQLGGVKPEALIKWQASWALLNRFQFLWVFILQETIFKF